MRRRVLLSSSFLPKLMLAATAAVVTIGLVSSPASANDVALPTPLPDTF